MDCGDATMDEGCIFQEEDNKRNLEILCACSIIFKVYGLWE